MVVAPPKRILRLTGSYKKLDGVSEADFHKFMSTDHAVKSAKIHERYGILKYQLAFNNTSTRAVADSLKLPWPTYSSADVIIEYYFENLESLIGISSDEDFKALHVDCIPFINMETTVISLTWIEVFLENGKVINVNSEGESLHPSFAEASKIEVSDKPADKYY